MTASVQAPKSLPGWIWGGVFGCLVIISWMGWNKYRPATAAEQALLAEKVGGPHVLELIRDADRVYATRIGLKTGKTHWETLDDFEAIAEPFLIPESEQQLLKELLTSPRNYLLAPLPAACTPRWGFRLRFLKGDEAVEVWVCLECHHMQIVQDGKEIGGVRFARMAREIDALAIRLFPDDSAIAEAAR